MNSKNIIGEGGKLIYLFDDLGQMKTNLLEYPDQIKTFEGSLRAIDYLNLTSNRKITLISLLHTLKK